MVRQKRICIRRNRGYPIRVRQFLIEEGHRTCPIHHNGKLLVAGGGQALVRMNPDTVRELIGEVDVSDFKL